MICRSSYSMGNNWGSMVDRGMSLGAGLGGEGEGDLLTAGLPNHNLLLLHSVGGISKLGDIEALVLYLVLTLHLRDLDGLGDTNLLGGWVGEGTGDLERYSNKRNLVGLGLVLFPAYLMFSSISIGLVAIGRCLSIAGGHLHGL